MHIVSRFLGVQIETFVTPLHAYIVLDCNQHGIFFALCRFGQVKPRLTKYCTVVRRDHRADLDAATPNERLLY